MKSLLKKIIGWDENRAISTLEKNGYAYLWREERVIDGLLVGKILCKRTCEILTMKTRLSDEGNIVVGIN